MNLVDQRHRLKSKIITQVFTVSRLKPRQWDLSLSVTLTIGKGTEVTECYNPVCIVRVTSENEQRFLNSARDVNKFI